MGPSNFWRSLFFVESLGGSWIHHGFLICQCMNLVAVFRGLSGTHLLLLISLHKVGLIRKRQKILWPALASALCAEVPAFGCNLDISIVSVGPIYTGANGDLR